MRLRPAGVLFDLDGVLVDTRDAWFALMNAAARDLMCPPIRRDAFDESWGQSIAADARQFYPGHENEVVSLYYERHFEEHVEHLRVEPFAAQLLERLRERGLPSAVVTNTARRLALQILELAGLGPPLLVASDEVARPKPAPDLPLAACAALGLAPREVCLVGDSANDREAARAAGVAFVGFGIAGDHSVSNLDQLAALIGLVSV
ncbi:HAD family hydrolase [Polyangium mundeleinium]|uniref:phosphoglycolate phosphatase n=1 Tax=Polyangium mundeleinium TaxID=2995306 RepID=A0ABT5ENL6_9BACT|nr:HAD-IA family hydrolase [Polyangium mundeleinium]MDC0742934.1 HAD-IA family hydrolase [Polyangium mundeleinium]